MGKKRSKMGTVASTFSQWKITRKISRLEKTLPSAISGRSYCVELDAVASSLQKKQSKDIDFYSKMYPRVENLQKRAKHTLMENKYTPDQLMSQQSSNDQASVYSTKANQNIETVIFIEGEKPVSTKGRRTQVPEIHQPNRVNSTYSTTRSSSSRQDVNASGRPKSKQGKNVGQKQESERLSTTFVKKSSDGRTFGPTYQVQRSEFRRPASDMEPKSHPEMHNHIQTKKWREIDVVAGDTDYQRFGNQNIQASSSSCTTKCANSMSPEQVMQNSSKEKFPETRGTWQNDQTSSLSTDSDYRRSKTANSVGYTRPASDGRGRRQGTGFRQQTSVGYSTVASTGAALIETQLNYSLAATECANDSGTKTRDTLGHQSSAPCVENTLPSTDSGTTMNMRSVRTDLDDIPRGGWQNTDHQRSGHQNMQADCRQYIDTESDGTCLDSQASSYFSSETETNIANSMPPEQQRVEKWIKETYPDQLVRTETRGPCQNGQTSSLSTTDAVYGRSKTNNFVGDTRPLSDGRDRRHGTEFHQQTSVGYSTVASTGAAFIETHDSGTKPGDTSGHQSSAPSVDNRNQQNGTSCTTREMSQDFITPYEHGTEIEAEVADAATEEQTQDNYVNNRHAQETSVSTPRTGRKRQDGRVEEKKDEALEIVDVHQYFRNDFSLKELDQLDDLTKIGKVLDQAMNFENPVKEFHETNYSIEYFVLDEKLMRLIEYLDKIRCQDDEVIQKKVAAIEYIRGLHAILDERASDD